MLEEEEEVPPIDPKRVALFVVLVTMVLFAGWRYWRAQAAVAAVAEASKDYRRLFPARAAEPVAAPAPQQVMRTESASSGMMLKVDDDMRAPKPAPAAAPPAAPPVAAAPPVVEAKVEAAAPAKPAKKAFNQPRLNSGAFSGLNGGSGISYSGQSMSAVGAPPPVAPSDPAAAAAAAAAAAKK